MDLHQRTRNSFKLYYKVPHAKQKCSKNIIIIIISIIIIIIITGLFLLGTN